jgi:hypothetical protein
MEAFLLSLHVVAGILFVGPASVAVSIFPRFAPQSTGSVSSAPDERSERVALLLHRITRGYGTLALIVPAIGIALALVQGRIGEIWITVAMALTAVSGGLLALQIVPRQRDALDNPSDGRPLRRLTVLSGLFNLTWVAVVVLMIVRPGSAYSA